MGSAPLAVATVPADAILKNCRRFGCWGDDIVVSSALYSCKNDVGSANTVWADIQTLFASSGNPAGNNVHPEGITVKDYLPCNLVLGSNALLRAGILPDRFFLRGALQNLVLALENSIYTGKCATCIATQQNHRCK
jgi:hypothetical protein